MKKSDDGVGNLELYIIRRFLGISRVEPRLDNRLYIYGKNFFLYIWGNRYE